MQSHEYCSFRDVVQSLQGKVISLSFKNGLSDCFLTLWLFSVNSPKIRNSIFYVFCLLHCIFYTYVRSLMPQLSLELSTLLCHRGHWCLTHSPKLVLPLCTTEFLSSLKHGIKQSIAFRRKPNADIFVGGCEQRVKYALFCWSVKIFGRCIVQS